MHIWTINGRHLALSDQGQGHGGSLKFSPFIPENGDGDDFYPILHFLQLCHSCFVRGYSFLLKGFADLAL